MSDNSIELSGIFSEGYGIAPKKLLRMKLDGKIGKQKGKNVKLILLYMLSYTGAGKNECFPSIKTISEDLEISKPTVIEAINNACKLGFIEKSKMYPDNPLKQNHKYTLRFLTMNGMSVVSKESLLRDENGFIYKVKTFEQNNNINNSNNINKESTIKNCLGYKLSKLLYSLHKQTDDKYSVTESRLIKWANDIRLLHERDNRAYDEIEEIIKWVKTPGNFWFANIMSGKKLREKYPQLIIQYKKPENKPKVVEPSPLKFGELHDR